MERTRIEIRAPKRKPLSVADLARHVASVVRVVREHGTDDQREASENLSAWMKDTQNRLDLYIRVAAAGVASEMATHDMEQALDHALASVSNLEKELARGTSVSAKAQTALAEVISSLKALASAFSTLRPFFAAGRGQTTTFGLFDAITTCARLFDLLPDRSRADLQVTVPAEIRVRMAPGHFHQILINLLDNAFHWVSQAEGARVIQIGAAARPDRVECTLTNSGPPIDEDHLPYVTEPFYTTRTDDKTRGLGLYIVEDILANIGQTLRIDPQGQFGGPVFTFGLPKAE